VVKKPEPKKKVAGAWDDDSDSDEKPVAKPVAKTVEVKKPQPKS